MNFKFRVITLFGVGLILAASVSAQQAPKYSYAAQSKFIPKELGRVYIGMPLRDFAKVIDISKSWIENERMEELQLHIPFQKGNVAGLTVQIAGFPVEGRDDLLVDGTTKLRDDDGEEFDSKIKRPNINKIPASAFVYVYTITFKPGFAQKAYVTKLYGKGTVRAPDDQFRFSDIEWSKRTSDGLLILIRSLHEMGERRLMLYGRIKGTEWGLDEIDD